MKKTSRLFLVICILAFASCAKDSNDSDDGGGGGSATPDNNACSVLGLQSRIIAGTACSGRSPVVRLQIQEGDAFFSCTGTLISPNKVLTASHCVLDETFTTAVPAANISVSTGDPGNSLARGSRVIASPTVRSDLQAIAVDAQQNGDDPSSPDFNLVPYVQELGLSDIAVVVLNKNLSLPTASVRISKIPSDGTLISIFGFGAIDANAISATTVLYSGEMSLDNSGPKNVFAIYNGRGSDTCYGDSGGPAFAQESDGSYSIVATTLGGSTKCTAGDNAIFTATAGDGIGSFLRSAAPDAHFR